MGEIKSAAEIAAEKIAKLGEVTEEERLKWKYEPEGEKLAGRYIREECHLDAEIKKYEAKARQHVARSAGDILIRNITLPKTDAARRNSKMAMEGIKVLKNDKIAVENVLSKIRHVLDYYAQHGREQERQTYESLRAEFTARVQQAIKQQTGTDAQMNIDVESQPQFQDEWQRLQAQLDHQYTQHLDEYKRELAAID
jgi:hypothetical protein